MLSSGKATVTVIVLAFLVSVTTAAIIFPDRVRVIVAVTGATAVCAWGAQQTKRLMNGGDDGQG